MLRRSANIPEQVRLTSGRLVGVYNKSFHALCWLDSLAAGHRYASEAASLAATEDNAEALEVVQRYPLVTSLSTRLWAWILTEGNAESTAALPFDDKAAEIDVPEWTETLMAEDLPLLVAAHARVNHKDHVIINSAFPSDPRNDSRLPLSGFLNTFAEGRHRPLDVFRTFSLGEVFASAVSQAEAAREARANAKAGRESGTVPSMPAAANA